MRKVNTSTKGRYLENLSANTRLKEYGGLPVLGLVPASSWVGSPAGGARSSLPSGSWHVAVPPGCGHCGGSPALKDTHDHDVCDAISKNHKSVFGALTEMRAACCGLYTVSFETEITHKGDFERDRSFERAAPLRSR